MDIYEANAEPTGLIIHGVAPYKITHKDAINEMDYPQNQFGFKLFYSDPINFRENQSLESTYEAIFLGIGLRETKGIAINEENISHVYGAVEFIESLKLKHEEIMTRSDRGREYGHGCRC